MRKFAYTVGAPQTTEMVISRGIVKNPQDFELIPESSKKSKIFVFTDETVARLYGVEFESALRSQGYDTCLMVYPDGENTKTIGTYAEAVEKVISFGPDEGSVFISLGGGVICNFCGFIAATIHRGLTLIHIPTSLMAQCDAAISHKQALNGRTGKNLVGAYYSPHAVYVDVDVLNTLNERLLRDGMAEIIKHALGIGEKQVQYLLEAKEEFWGDSEFMQRVLLENISHKCEIVQKDPNEDAEGVILLYGHAIGHAIEFWSRGDLYHGESIGIGMVMSARIGELLGVSTKEFTQLHLNLMQKFKLPVYIPDNLSFEDFFKYCKFDKKSSASVIRMGLLKDVGILQKAGDDFHVEVPEEVLKEAFILTRKPNV